MLSPVLVMSAQDRPRSNESSYLQEHYVDECHDKVLVLQFTRILGSTIIPHHSNNEPLSVDDDFHQDEDKSYAKGDPSPRPSVLPGKEIETEAMGSQAGEADGKEDTKEEAS
uniref:Uncharacterized protein n=1 Tax=Micrurus lemniscatus lemniscatus TaxID=129467 RepID=A0A2D4HRN0_MICLE